MNTHRFIKKVFLLVVWFCFVHASLNAQLSLLEEMLKFKGFLVNNGDTIHGSVILKQKYIENYPYEIKFIDENGTSNIYDAGMISGFGMYSIAERDEWGEILFYGLETYESRPSMKKGLPVFMKVLLPGRIKVILNNKSSTITTTKSEQNTKMDGIAFSFSTGEGLSIGPSYKTSYRIIEERTRYTSYFVEKDGGTMIKISKQEYDALFPSFFGDCEAIQKEIENNPKLALFRNFMILTEIYNQICPPLK